MRALRNRLGGNVSDWLLSRPSHRAVGHANLRIAFAICGLIAFASIAFVVAQWVISERIYTLQKSKDAALAGNLGKVQKMAIRLSNAHRSTLNALLASDGNEFSNACGNLAENLERYTSLLNEQETGNSPDLMRKKEGLFASLESYRTISEHVLTLAISGKMEEALSVRISKLRPVFDEWQKKQDQFFVVLNTHESREQAGYVQAIVAARAILLMLILVPAVLIFSGTIAIIAIIGWGNFRQDSSVNTWVR